MAKETTFMVFFKLGWDTVESSMYIVEHELDFLITLNSPLERELASCIWLRFLTRPSENEEKRKWISTNQGMHLEIEDHGCKFTVFGLYFFTLDENPS